MSTRSAESVARVLDWLDDLAGDQYREVQIRHYGPKDRGDLGVEDGTVVARAYRAPKGGRGEWVARGGGSEAADALRDLSDALGDGGNRA